MQQWIENGQIAVRIWFATKISCRNIRLRLVDKDRSCRVLVGIRSRTNIRKLLSVNIKKLTHTVKISIRILFTF